MFGLLILSSGLESTAVSLQNQWGGWYNTLSPFYLTACPPPTHAHTHTLVTPHFSLLYLHLSVALMDLQWLLVEHCGNVPKGSGMLRIPVPVVCFVFVFLLVLLLLLKLMFLKLLDAFLKKHIIVKKKEVGAHTFEGLARRFMGSGTKDMEFFGGNVVEGGEISVCLAILTQIANWKITSSYLSGKITLKLCVKGKSLFYHSLALLNRLVVSYCHHVNSCKIEQKGRKVMYSKNTFLVYFLALKELLS